MYQIMRNMIRKFYDWNGEGAPTSYTEKYVYTTDKDNSVNTSESNTYMTTETTITIHESLIDAMRAQAQKNKEICDEIIRKADNFEKELKNGGTKTT